MKRILTLAIVLCSSTGLFAQTYAPTFKADAGKQYKVTSSVKGNATQEAMGQTIEMPFDLVSTSTAAVKTTGKEGTDVASTIDKITMNMSVMDQNLNYDSEKGGDDSPLATRFKDHIGKTTTFKVDNTGRIIQGSVVKPAAGKTEEGGMDMTQMMGSVAGDVATGIAPIFDLLPAGSKAMAVGESVSDNTTTEGDTKTKKTMTYTLVEIKDGQAKFSLAGTTSTEGKMEVQGMSMTLSSSSKEEGEMFVNAATGLLIKKVITSAITGNIEVSGMQIPMTGKTTVTTEVSPK